MDASAYTIGRDLYFAPGRYAPRTPEGSRMLAHELAHVVQQAQPGTAPASSASEAEREARVAADTVAAGMSFPVQSRTGVSVACAPPTAPTQIPAKQRTLGPPLPLEESGAAPIPPADRHSIEMGASVALPLAYTNFTWALADHVAAINAEAKAKAEMTAAVIDVLTGFAAPVFANWAVGKLARLAGEVPGDYAKALLLGLIKREDVFKAAFTGATKASTSIIKAEAQPLFGETEIKLFGDLLAGAFNAGILDLGNRLGSMSDEELLAVWTAYSKEFNNRQAYRDALAPLFAHYKEQVEPLGKTVSIGPDEAEQSVTSNLYEVQLAARKRLATIDVWERMGPILWAWITPDMEAVARAKAAKVGHGIPTIALKDVQVFLYQVLDPPRPDLRGKDMLEVVQALSPADRQRAAADPDVIAVVETQHEMSGRVPNQYQRHMTLFALRGFSSQAIACLDELDSLFVNWTVINQNLQATSAAERSRLAQDQWFVGRLRAELSGYGLGQVLFTLGLEPKPPPEPKPYYHPSPRWR